MTNGGQEQWLKTCHNRRMNTQTFPHTMPTLLCGLRARSAGPVAYAIAVQSSLDSGRERERCYSPDFVLVVGVVRVSHLE